MCSFIKPWILQAIIITNIVRCDHWCISDMSDFGVTQSILLWMDLIKVKFAWYCKSWPRTCMCDIIGSITNFYKGICYQHVFVILIPTFIYYSISQPSSEQSSICCGCHFIHRLTTEQSTEDKTLWMLYLELNTNTKHRPKEESEKKMKMGQKTYKSQRVEKTDATQCILAWQR